MDIMEEDTASHLRLLGVGVHPNASDVPVGQNMMSPDSGYGDDGGVFSPEAACVVVDIVDQPEDSYNFRYLKESKKPHGPLKSIGCKGEKPKFSHGPRVQLSNFGGRAIVRAWLCDGDGLPSHNRLVTSTEGKLSKLIDEPHDITIDKSNRFLASFDKLNILHGVGADRGDQINYLKKKRFLPTRKGALYTAPENFPMIHDNDAELKTKELHDHIRKQDKDTCRLLFEVYIEQQGQYYFHCSVLSNKIYNKKSPKTNIPHIAKCSHAEGPSSGGTEVLIFTEKLVKEIKIVFFDDDEWEEEAMFGEKDIHKQYGVAFKTPPYKSDVCEKVVQFYIERTTDGARSKSYKFRYMPTDCDFLDLRWPIKRKRVTPTHPLLAESANPLLTEAASPTRAELGYLPLADPADQTMLMDPLDMPLNLSEFLGCRNTQAENDSFPGVSSLESNLDSTELHKFENLPDVYLRNLAADSLPGRSSPLQYRPKALGVLRVESLEGNEHSSQEVEDEDLASRALMLIQSIKINEEKSTLLLLSLMNLSQPSVNWKFAGKTLLHYAVIYRQSKVTAELLKAGADPYALDDCNSNTPIHLATLADNKVLQQILPSVTSKSVFNRDGDDPLLFAVKKLQPYATKLLLKGGFDPNVQNVKDGNTPMHIAVQNGQTDVVDFLLKCGADSSKFNYAWETPLHYAVSKQNGPLVDAILQKSDPADFLEIEGLEDGILSRDIISLSNDPRITRALEKFFGSQTKAAGTGYSPFQLTIIVSIVVAAVGLFVSTIWRR